MAYPPASLSIWNVSYSAEYHRLLELALDFDPQSVWCGGCQLVHSFQADPEVSPWNAELSLVVGPVEIEVCGIVQLLMYDDPAINWIHKNRVLKCWDIDVHQMVLCHTTWRIQLWFRDYSTVSKFAKYEPLQKQQNNAAVNSKKQGQKGRDFKMYFPIIKNRERTISSKNVVAWCRSDVGLKIGRSQFLVQLETNFSIV